MPAYHQMGHDSRNLLGEVPGFAGAIISPVNEEEDDVAQVVEEHASDTFEFVFDPQLYFPRRSDRGQLATWDYFPQDLDTADLSSAEWWSAIIKKIVETSVRVGARAICSPATISASTFTNDYYDAMRGHADLLTDYATEQGLRSIETVIVRLADLAATRRALEIASVVSSTRASGIYLVLLSEVRPRDELSDVEQLKGAMKLIHSLEESGLPVLVGCSSSDVILWKTAGATSCASGKFHNLRRFTQGRFNDADEGGRQVPYWFEEAFLAFIRTSDLLRVREAGFVATTANPFGAKILKQLDKDPSKAWVALGWRQYLHWFAEVEARLSSRVVSARDLIRRAEANWQTLEERDVFMEERSNSGGWLRPWLRAVAEFNK